MIMSPRRMIQLSGCALLITIFASDLSGWFRFGLSSDLYSYTLLVPPMVVYLFYPRRLIMLASAGWLALVLLANVPPVTIDYARLYVFVTLMILTFAALVGWSALFRYVIPLMLLYLAIPLPPAADDALNHLLQHGSSWWAAHFFSMLGIPVYRDGLHLILPGLNLFVAESCSGIRSTLALFLAAAAGGCFLLHRTWHRLLILSLVIPIGMLRNALRITTLGWLALYVDPAYLQGQLHLRGGPLFFIISLIPLWGVFVWLHRREHRQSGRIHP